ncbi:MAG TPA: pyridoxal-phosphate dependent enzyme [Thermoanaerobaculia bacterium]|jgi:threonine dehydratase|nr:pyridoxal-phosphate dependent enzyme [Thermoanaerobaculia bacterium]
MSAIPLPDLPSFDALFAEVRAAAVRVRAIAHRTPIATSRALDETVGARVFLKCENLQRVGAFKIRGAWNAVSQLTAEERTRGVLTFSSGNHAQGIALACREQGVAATVVMPVNSPASKREATAGYGAEIILYDPDESAREELAAKLQDERGSVVIPPYDDLRIICGQATAALELLEDQPDLDLLLVPCGGGGLLSGSAISARGAAPNCRVIGVEPETANDATFSFRTGVLHTVKNPPTIADGTRTPSLGKLTFPLVREYVADMATVSEAAIAEAVRFLFARTKLVVEPSGALGVAALLSGEVKPPSGARVGVILSGGNVDGEVMARILTGEL